MFTIVQFSPTGNTAHIADLLSNYLETDQVYALEHTSPTYLPNTGHIIILYAIHAFNAPKTVKRFINNMPKNKFNKVSLIGVGCNDSWLNYAASKDIRYMLEAKHYPVVVDEIIAMPLTFIMSFPEDVINNQITEAHNKIKKLSFDIKESVVSEKNLMFKSRLVHWIGRIEPFAAKFFGLELHSTKKCTQCGLCIKECPEHNIRMRDNGKLKFGMKCMMCMRCIYNCPSQAIVPRISKFIPLKNGYSIEQHLKKGDANE